MTGHLNMKLTGRVVQLTFPDEAEAAAFWHGFLAAAAHTGSEVVANQN